MDSSKFLHLKKIISCELNSQQLNKLRYDQTDSLIGNLATNRLYFRSVLIRCGIQNTKTELIIFGKTFNPKQEYLTNYLVIFTSRFLKDGSLVSTKIYYDLKRMDELIFKSQRRTSLGLINQLIQQLNRTYISKKNIIVQLDFAMGHNTCVKANY